MNDEIFNEVDEEVRREQMIALARRYGPYAIGVIMAVILAVSGYTFYGSYQESRMEAQSAAYEEALAQVYSGDVEAALAALGNVESGSTGYAVLASFQRAALLTQEGDIEGAIAAYDTIRAESRDEDIDAMASILASYALVDAGRVDEAVQRLGAIAEEEGAWQPAAQELLAFISLQSGELDDAESRLIQIVNTPSTPQGIRTRANEFLDIIDQTRLSMAPVGSDGDIEEDAIDPEGMSQ